MPRPALREELDPPSNFFNMKNPDNTNDRDKPRFTLTDAYVHLTARDLIARSKSLESLSDKLRDKVKSVSFTIERELAKKRELVGKDNQVYLV